MAHQYSYTSMILGALPVTKYRATMSVTADADGSVIRWSGRYEGKDGQGEHAKQLIAAIHDMGLTALKKHFGGS